MDYMHKYLSTYLNIFHKFWRLKKIIKHHLDKLLCIVKDLYSVSVVVIYFSHYHTAHENKLALHHSLNVLFSISTL